MEGREEDGERFEESHRQNGGSAPRAPDSDPRCVPPAGPVSYTHLVLVFAFIFRIVGVDGTSMMPTLRDYDRLILTHFLYEPERGDIVVINRYDNEPLVKRIVAVGEMCIRDSP